MATEKLEWIRSALPGFLIAGAVFAGSAAASLIVTPSNDALLLADSIAGPGIAVNGVKTYTYGAGDAFGTFSNGLASSVGIDQGLIISSGMAEGAVGPNLFGPSTYQGTVGFSGLSQFLGGTRTYDGALLNLSFTTSAPGSLNFAFSVGTSECCGIRDAYSFLLDGERAFVGSVAAPSTYAGYSTGGFTSTYASLGGGTALAPNDPRLGVSWISDLINVSFGNLDPGQHSLVIAIGDGVDGFVDSVVFVGPLGFDATIAAPSTIMLFALGLVLVLLRRKQRRFLIHKKSSD